MTFSCRWLLVSRLKEGKPIASDGESSGDEGIRKEELQAEIHSLAEKVESEWREELSSLLLSDLWLTLLHVDEQKKSSEEI